MRPIRAAVRTDGTEEWSLPGRLIRNGETLAHALREAFEPRATNYKGQLHEEDRTRLLLDQLFDMSDELSGKDDRIVYRGYVDDPRNTDNAWIETTAVHFHMSRELASKIKLQAYSEAERFLKLKRAKTFSRRLLERVRGAEDGSSADEGTWNTAVTAASPTRPKRGQSGTPPGRPGGGGVAPGATTPRVLGRRLSVPLRSSLATARKLITDDHLVCWRDVDEHLMLYASHQQWVYHVKGRLMRNQPVATMRELTTAEGLVMRLSCRQATEHATKRTRDPDALGGKLGLQVLIGTEWTRREECNTVEECIDRLQPLANRCARRECALSAPWSCPECARRLASPRALSVANDH